MVYIIYLYSIYMLSQVMAFLSGDPQVQPPKQAPKKSRGRVIVVGAGPAGLAAGLHLKVNGLFFMFLQANDLQLCEVQQQGTIFQGRSRFLTSQQPSAFKNTDCQACITPSLPEVCCPVVEIFDHTPNLPC